MAFGQTVRVDAGPGEPRHQRSEADGMRKGEGAEAVAVNHKSIFIGACSAVTRQVSRTCHQRLRLPVCLESNGR